MGIKFWYSLLIGFLSLFLQHNYNRYLKIIETMYSLIKMYYSKRANIASRMF